MSLQILFMGNKKRATVCLEALLKHGKEVVGVVAHPDPSIEDWYPSLPDYARTEGISVYQPRDVNSLSFRETVSKLSVDLIVMAGYNQILGPEFLSLPSDGTINLHGGKLPSYRGASTLNWMIINGEKKGGIAIHYVDESIDTGPIIRQETFEIRLEDTIVDIIARTNDLFPEMLVQTVEEIESNSVNPTPQDRSEGSYFHSRKPRDGEIRWGKYTARQIYDLVRALNGPYPGAFTYFNGDKLKIWEAGLIEESVKGVPGRICRRRDSGVEVVASNRGLLIETVQPENGKRQTANQFFERLGQDLG